MFKRVPRTERCSQDLRAIPVSRSCCTMQTLPGDMRWPPLRQESKHPVHSRRAAHTSTAVACSSPQDCMASHRPAGVHLQALLSEEHALKRKPLAQEVPNEVAAKAVFAVAHVQSDPKKRSDSVFLSTF